MSNQESREEISSLKQKIKDLEKDLSDRMHAYEVLRRSEAKYRLLVENASEAIFIAQGEKLVFVNMAASRYTGYTVQELMTHPFIEFIYPDDRAMVMRRHLDCLKGEEVPTAYTFRVVRKDGRILWGELSGILIDWEGERATLNFMTDVTERRSAEEALQESESTHRTLLANLPVGVIMIDPLSKTIEEVNNTAAEMFGATSERIIGHRCHAFLCPANEGACPVCDLGQEVDNSERQIIRTDGSIHPVLKSVKRVKIKGQEKLLECFIDITDRARAERDLKNTHSHLERVLKFNETLLSAIPTPVFYKDGEGRYLGCNRAFTEIMGVTSDQIKGKTVMELWPGEHAEMYHEKDLELMQKPARQVYEFMVRDKDGKDRMVIFAKDVFLDESGQAAGIVGAFLDITNQKLADKAVRLNESRLEALLNLNHMADTSIAEITSFALKEAVRLTESSIGYIGFTNDDGTIFTLHSWSESVAKEIVTTDKPVEYQVASTTGPWGEVIRQNRTVIVNNYTETISREEGIPEGHLPVTRHINVPIRTGDRVALVAGVGNKNVPYDDTDVQQLTLLMEGMWKIIRQKQAEKELREKELFLEGTQKIARLGGWKANPHTDYLEWTKGVYDIIEAPHDYKPGLSEGLTFYLPEYIPIITDEVKKCLSTGQSFKVECQLVTMTGKKLWTEVRGLSPVLEGSHSYVLGTLQDITERKQTEIALADEATRRRILIEQSSDGIVILDQDGRVYESNQKFADMLGYSLEEMSTLTVFDWEALTSRERIVEMIRTVDEKGERFETRHRRKDGAVYDVEISTNAALFAGQKLIFCVCRDISQRIEAEEALRVSEERFRTFFNLPIVGFSITDTEGAWIHFNDKLAEMLGYSRDELPLKTWMELTPSEDLTKEREFFMQVVRGAKNTSNFEKRYIRKDGSLLDVFISTQVVRNADGSVAYFASIIQDISDRKRDEKDRRLNAQRTETLLKLNQMATAPLQEITDYVLEEAVRLTKSTIGYLAFLNDDESILTMHSWSKTAMNECSMEQKPIRYPVQETGLWGEAVRQRKPIITNDYNAPSPWKKGYPAGHVRISRHMNVPIFGESKIVLVAGVGNKEEQYNTDDVQQLTLLMEGMWRLIERNRSSEEILIEREKLKILSDNAPFGMVLVDREGCFTYMNAKFTVLFGYTLSDTPDGRTWFRKAYPDSKYRHTVIATWLNDLGDRSPGQRNPRTFTVTCKNGTQKIINFIPSVLVSGDYLMTCEDITELRRLENQLRQAQKMEAIGTLAGGIAHDFNNILTVMTGYTALMQIRLDASHPVRPYVDQILLASKKAADLTRSLLTFSRKQPVTLVPLDITRTIQETEKLLRRLLTEDIELRTSFTEDNMIVMADKSQIDQILFNLVTNARDAMPGGGTLTISTSPAVIDGRFIAAHEFGEYGRYVKISVSDTGTGMDTKTLQSIFDPFFTTKETGKGTGLGLATVYGIVKQHNGYITVDSALNRGTVFHVYIPEIQGKVDETQGIAVPLQRGEETVLIAEDNEDVRFFMRDVLQQHGYKVLEAVDGEDAIDTFVRNRGVDLVILDSVMPKKNGREVYEAIRAINPSIKALFTSGYTKDIILDKGIGEKEFDFIAKPLLPDSFLRKVREVLDSPGHNNASHGTA